MAKRGVQVSDLNASLVVAVPAPSAHVVAVGAAPVGSLPGFTWTTPGSGVSPYASVVNVPIYCQEPQDFTTNLGLSLVFGPGVKGAHNTTGKYGLSEVYDFMFVENNAGPMTAINVNDPWLYSTHVTSVLYTVNSTLVNIVGEVILASLHVTGQQSGHVGVQNIDYTFTYDDETLQSGFITILSSGNLFTDTSINVDYYTPNLALITDAIIIGGTTVSGQRTGGAVLENVFNVTGQVPSIVITPGFGSDPTVIAAFQSHVQGIANGRFRAVYLSDINTVLAPAFTNLVVEKSNENLQTTWEYAGWPHCYLGSLNSIADSAGTGKCYHASTVMAVTMQNTDNQFGQIPYVSPSNKVVSITGTYIIDTFGKQKPIIIDSVMADFAENVGLFTFLNAQGWKSLGDYTCAYPTNTNIQDMLINERRMFNWLGNTLSLTLAQFIDLAGNTQDLTTINETIQAFLNTLIQAGAANTASCSFNPNENSAIQVMAGIYTYHILWTPPTPIRTLDLLLQYDVKGLTAWISTITISNTSNIVGV